MNWLQTLENVLQAAVAGLLSDIPRIAIESIDDTATARRVQSVRKANDIHLSLAAASAAVLAGVLRGC